MKNTTSTQDLGERIERLVREHISDIHVAAQAAVGRAFASHIEPRAKQRRASERARSGSKRRTSSEVAALGERFYQAVCARPGETMTVLAPVVGATAPELHRPVTLLKRSGRIRSVGSRHAMRYFPMAGQAAAAE